MTEPVSFNPQGQTIYDQIGGEETFRKLVWAFYARVEDDPVLRPLFPADLEPGKYHQMLFLMQFWGGPAAYDSLRGHPRLRMRHAPFKIGQIERDRWVSHMLGAIDEVSIPEPARSEMREYFERAGTFMINTQE
jgi:hemoglobin